MMRKTSVSLLVGVFVLGVTACGEEKNDDSDASVDGGGVDGSVGSDTTSDQGGDTSSVQSSDSGGATATDTGSASVDTTDNTEDTGSSSVTDETVNTGSDQSTESSSSTDTGDVTTTDVASDGGDDEIDGGVDEMDAGGETDTGQAGDAGVIDDICDELIFRQGTRGYDGVIDIEIHDDANDDDDQTEVEVDGDELSVEADEEDHFVHRQTLIRFDDIFGNGANLIPTDAAVASAELVLYGTNGTEDDISLHEMIAAWNETTTWVSLEQGVSADDVEAVASPIGILVAPATEDETYTFDVTASVARWQSDIALNQGWVLLNSGDDSWAFASSDSGGNGPGGGNNRPSLVVTVCPAQ